MNGAVLFIFYGSILFCVVSIIVITVKCVTAPLHLRWELYFKSSVYELPQWWTRRHLTFGEKLKSIIVDIIFLRKYYQQNRKFWNFLYPFHIGVYLLILWHIWLFAIPMLFNSEAAPMPCLVLGYVSITLIIMGSVGILVKRLTDPELKAYYSVIHYFKWVLILVTVGGAFYGVYFHFGNNMIQVIDYVKEQLAFKWDYKLNPPLLPALHVLFIAGWLIYLPFSHIMKLFYRYYHELRWDHVPNLPGSNMEKQINKLLDRPVSWAASHAEAGKTWGELATPEKRPR